MAFILLDVARAQDHHTTPDKHRQANSTDTDYERHASGERKRVVTMMLHRSPSFLFLEAALLSTSSNMRREPCSRNLHRGLIVTPIEVLHGSTVFAIMNAKSSPRIQLCRSQALSRDSPFPKLLKPLPSSPDCPMSIISRLTPRTPLPPQTQRQPGRCQSVFASHDPLSSSTPSIACAPQH